MNKAKEKNNNSLNWTVLLIISSAYITTELNLQGFLSLMPFIQKEFALTRAQAGLYSSFYFLSATMIAIFSGRIVDLIGSKRGMVFSIFSIGVLIFFHSLAPMYSVILLLAFITGLCFSLITPAVSKSIMELISPENRAVSMGIIHAGGGIGGFLGASILPLLAGWWGWRRSLLFPALLAILLALFVLKFYHSKDREREKSEKGYLASFKDDILLLIKNRYMICVCCLGFAFGCAIGAIPAHFTLFLTRDIGTKAALAGFGFGLLQIGSIIGKPGWGWVSDRVFSGNRRRSLFTMALMIVFWCWFIGLFMFTFDFPVYIIYIITIFLGATAMGWPGLHFTTIAELASEKHTGTATGISLIFSRLGVVCSPPIFGYIADVTGNYRLSWFFLGFILLIFSAVFFWYTGKLKHTH